MLQTLPFAAGGRQINAKATFFRYESGDAGGLDTSVRVRADGNDLGLFLPGDNIELPVSASRWELVPVLGSCTGTVRLGMGKVSGSRLVGTVSVVDQSAAKSATGNQFIGTVLTGASASWFGLAGIRATAGKVVVKRCSMVSNVAGLLTLYSCTGDTTNNPSNYAAALQNKLSGQPVCSAKALRGLSAIAAPTVGELPGVTAICTIQAAANVPAELPMTTPFLLGVGFGLVAQGPAINAQIGVTFDTEEI